MLFYDKFKVKIQNYLTIKDLFLWPFIKDFDLIMFLKIFLILIKKNY